MHPAMRFVTFFAVVAAAVSLSAQERDLKVHNDRKMVEEGGYWIYNDLPKAFAEARKTGKPLAVVIRCIPCEACAKLDAQVVSRDPTVQKLLDQFVCVRIVQTNGLDLSLFQYDYDQSFAAFFLNADNTVYGRFGTRSHARESNRDVSVEGFGRALAGALELHQGFPANKTSLAAKRGADVAIGTPEQFPSLAGKYGPRLDYEGQVARSCIHCHQVGEAQRLVYRAKSEPIPEKLLYPYPMPNLLGLTLDPKQKARVLTVAADSSAQEDGFEPGDEIVALAGQPLLSIADVQWVLHHADDTGELPAEVLRGEKRLALRLTLPSGWRRRGDISWRATSWDLRRMTTGGMWLESLSADDRRRASLADDVLALRAKHVGEYGEHAAAKNAGFRQGDILVAVDGDSKALTESQLMAALVNGKRPGEKIEVVVLRDGERLTLKLPMQ